MSSACRKRNAVMINFPNWHSQRQDMAAFFTGRNLIMALRFFPDNELRDRQAALCDESEDPQARVIAATIKDVRVFSIYAPNGQAVGSPAFNYKLQWFAELRDCIAEAQKFFPILLYAEISMSRRKIVMCMIPAFGAAPLCVLRKNAPLFARSNRSVCAIPFASIMPKAVFLVGGIIGCWRFKKIADSASTRFLPANHWPNFAPPPGSIVKCAKARIRPITPRSGQSFSFVILSGAQRSRRISNYLSARPDPIVILKSQAMREKQRDPSLTS